MSRCANYRAHAFTHWAASYFVFENILIGSSILSSTDKEWERFSPITFYTIQIKNKKLQILKI
jgi:hypothetical protein